jgi:hypothetical protein
MSFKRHNNRFANGVKIFSMNDELWQIYDEDINDHAQGYKHGTREYKAMRERDLQHRQRVQQLIAEKQLDSAADYFHAARIFQHGDTPDDAWKAYQLAHQASELGEPRARWLTAAAYDRWLMYQGKPQKYGTQYVTDGQRQRLWDIDPVTSDAERAEWGVPPLAEQIRKAEEATRLHPPTPIADDAPEWLKDAIRRWKREKTGN